MTCDSAWTFHQEGAISVAREPKKIIATPVLSSDEQVLVGVAGAADYLCLLHQSFPAHYSELPTFENIQARIDKAFKEDDELWRTFARGSDPSILVAIGSKLYRIISRYSWIEVEDNIYAVGSGADLALGALYTLQGYLRPSTNIDGDTISAWMHVAMSTAATYDAGVRKPFHLVSTVRLRDEER
jgi:ATP-dependent protease HslVU (ClpYQ) peptidase subunit